MLLGLLAAVMLAVLLQLNAQRWRREDPFVFTADGTIHLRCWVVIETPALGACVRSGLAPALPAPARPARPLRFVGEARMLRRPPTRRPPVRTPPAGIVIPGDVLQALRAAEEISAAIWRSPPGMTPGAPPGRARPPILAGATFH
jgi:hypothetical protein